MVDKAALQAEAARLQSIFMAAGAEPVDPDLLLPAEMLLDLYGEDIRARAYVTDDPERGEMMLRPDFTVPIAAMHASMGAGPACYTYTGQVFRKQPVGVGRPNAYLQVGFEKFDRTAPIKADAEMFALFSRTLNATTTGAVVGDMGLLLAAIDTLSTTPTRKAALRRHVWRPRRFRALLDRYTGQTPMPKGRAALIAAVKAQGATPLIAAAAPEIGLRTTQDIVDRVTALVADYAVPPISSTEAGVLHTLLSLRAPLPAAYERMCDLRADMPGLTPALDQFATRMEALEQIGIDTTTLYYEANFGQTTMEYYDGFVFGFLAPHRPDLPPLATGGRYDALTRALGGGAHIVMPAIGGVIRPDLVLQAMAKTTADTKGAP